jgi:hypothetical protein
MSANIFGARLMSYKVQCVATLLGLGCLLSASSTLAAPLVFNIDSTLSSISLTMELTGGAPFTSAQFPGSNTTSLFGAMDVDVVPGTSVQFLTTGNTQLALQSLPVAPQSGGGVVGVPGSGPGQIGLDALIPSFAQGVLAARHVIGDSTSGAIPLVGNAFDSTGLSFALVSGNADYNLSTFLGPEIGTASIVGGGALDTLSGGTLTEVGTLLTLTLPLLVNEDLTIAGIPVTAVLTGQIVATATIPEPSTMVLACLAAIGLGVVAIRKRRKR